METLEGQNYKPDTNEKMTAEKTFLTTHRREVSDDACEGDLDVKITNYWDNHLPLGFFVNSANPVGPKGMIC